MYEQSHESCLHTDQAPAIDFLQVWPRIYEPVSRIDMPGREGT